MPYSRIKKGYVFKQYVDYSKRKWQTSLKDMIQEYIVDKDTKLSIHRSGFVQFSGSGITSGIDPKTGQIKGMGIFTSPLDHPIKTGPTFGFTLWGLQGFELANIVKKSVNEINFEEDDLYLRYYSSDSDDPNIDIDGYLIEGFYFGNYLLPRIRYENGKPQITLVFRNFEIPGTRFTLKVIFIENSPGFIGLMASKVALLHPGAETGYILNGPGSFRIGNISQTINCAYPIITNKPPKNNLSYDN
jgi:hypothetical protein